MSVAPNRLLRQWKARFGIRKRVREITDELRHQFPLRALAPSSHAGGFDSIYFLEDHGGERFGVLRLNNPHQKRKAVHTDLPRRSPPPRERIQREWHAYSVLGPLGLSPQPLWRSDDAVVCSYSASPNVRRLMEEGRADLTAVFTAVLNTIGKMHDAGIVHLDLSPGNVLVCRKTLAALLIDFEYVSLDARSVEDDKRYDWRQMIERIRKRSTILGQQQTSEAALAAAIDASGYCLRIREALADGGRPTANLTT
ncbi:3-deoxy-D-manno-octulosonic-acid kinase [Caulifigura coniformis]|uniref:3-deoxy-D-manno-octulosonic-acid kinase n=1 Tax=Caulifigura coniformis TaxID=2527983 RepID=A0A517SEG4_9PLAN|nr:lipopolysaccharide kinase InaA family protein [Caulifigura coniformis]QDT54523.1 3-deoxy-D-manno-octulosonic-acid kinase [Caulifigura coniformis]